VSLGSEERPKGGEEKEAGTNAVIPGWKRIGFTESEE